MSPPQKPTPSPHPSAHYQNATSPVNGSSFAPPAKRQRLSPDPRSPPNGVPPYASHANGVSAYGNPYAPSPVQAPYSPGYAQSPQSSFNTPQAYSPQQMQWAPQSQTPTPGPRPGHTSPPTAANTGSQLMPPPPKPVREDKEEKGDDYTDVLTGTGINMKDEEAYIATLWTNRHTANESGIDTLSDSGIQQ